jgi:hypothetical protein
MEADRFVGGDALRILTRADEKTAQTLAEKLRALGAVVAVEPSPPEFAMPSDISLMSLDGDEPVALLPEVEPPVAPAPVAEAPVEMPPERDLFSAPPIEQRPMELEQPKPPSPAPPSQEPIAPPVETVFEEDEPVEVIPGRLLQGKLRAQPLVRMLVGIALGLLVGYAVSAPYASRAERRVAQLRADANTDRYRPVDEARQNAARLDNEADDLAGSAFTTTILIWLGVAGAVVAGWYRIT